MPSGFAIVDGRPVPLDEAVIPVTDPGFSVGHAVFETLRSDDVGDVRRIEAHLARLRGSAASARIELPPGDVLAAEIRAVASAVGTGARIRVTCTGGGRRVVTGEPLDQSRLHRPVRAVRGPWRADPFLAGSVKHTSRAPWIAAVKRSGADEVLLVDEAGRFTEGTTCAILAVIDGRLWTAPHDGRILESTTCAEVLDRAAVAGIPVVREGPPAAGPWDALYIASTTRDLAPVVELDGVALPGWDPVGRSLAPGVV